MGNPGWKSAIQFLIGISIVVLVGLIALLLWPRPDLPPGWNIIRDPQDVMALVEYEGEIWTGGRDGLSVVDRETGDVLQEEFEPDGGFDYVTSLLLNPLEEALWIGHLNGLTRWEGKTWQTFTQSDGLPENQVLAMALGLDGELWVGTTGGLAQLTDGIIQLAPDGNPQESIATSALYLDSQGRLWIGNGHTRIGGLAMYDGHRWQEFSVEDGLAHPMINAIMEDGDDVLWIGTGFASLGGASLYDSNQFMTLTVDDGLAGPKVRSIYLDTNDTLWVGSEYDGVARQKLAGWEIFTPEDGLSGWEVKAMLHDSQGNFWLGTENGLTRIDASAWQALQNIEGN